jgi:hypothetical protein
MPIPKKRPWNSLSLKIEVSEITKLVLKMGKRIGKTIGEGTFGKVKLGKHIPTDEKVK